MQSLAGRELDADLTRPFRRYAVSNVLGADFTKYCQQMHQGNGGGLGGTTATHNSIEYSNESYDAKTIWSQSVAETGLDKEQAELLWADIEAKGIENE